MKWLNQLLAIMLMCSSVYGMNVFEDLPDIHFSDSPSLFDERGEFRIFECPKVEFEPIEFEPVVEEKQEVEKEQIPDDEKELRCDESLEDLILGTENPWAAVMQDASITTPMPEQKEKKQLSKDLVKAIKIFFQLDQKDEHKVLHHITDLIKRGADVERGFKTVHQNWPGKDHVRKRKKLLFIINMRLLRTMSYPFYFCGHKKCYLPHFVLFLLLSRTVLQKTVLGDALLPEAKIVKLLPFLMGECPNIAAHRISGRPLPEILKGLALLKSYNDVKAELTRLGFFTDKSTLVFPVNATMAGPSLLKIEHDPVACRQLVWTDQDEPLHIEPLEEAPVVPEQIQTQEIDLKTEDQETKDAPAEDEPSVEESDDDAELSDLLKIVKKIMKKRKKDQKSYRRKSNAWSENLFALYASIEECNYDAHDIQEVFEYIEENKKKLGCSGQVINRIKFAIYHGLLEADKKEFFGLCTNNKCTLVNCVIDLMAPSNSKTRKHAVHNLDNAKKACPNPSKHKIMGISILTIIKEITSKASFIKSKAARVIA